MVTEVGDAVQMYLRDIKGVEMLDAERELELGRHIQAMVREKRKRKPREAVLRAGEDAMRELVAANTRLAISIARRYVGQGVAMEDLIGAGNEGLMRAAIKFDPTKEFRFSTYATWWIKQAIQRIVTEQGSSPRVPPHVADLVRRIKRTMRQLQQDLQREPSLEEVGDVLDMSARQVSDVLQYVQPTVSLDAPLPGDTELRVGDTVADPRSDMTENAEDSERADAIEDVLYILPPEDRRVLQFRLGLGRGPGTKAHTLDQVAGEMGGTRENARLHEIEALAALKERRAQLWPFAS